jgi:hypothetical protein
VILLPSAGELSQQCGLDILAFEFEFFEHLFSRTQTHEIDLDIAVGLRPESWIRLRTDQNPYRPPISEQKSLRPGLRWKPAKIATLPEWSLMACRDA